MKSKTALEKYRLKGQWTYENMVHQAIIDTFTDIFIFQDGISNYLDLI